ncbi:hypothetical protein QCA50_004374 [Cerrena zonata]|uniref:F-box domain-containing protein n=1 Tax=Cerrena zonata TaxID=2478898 RepID=A0AAW0GJB3_9APHY
MAQPFIFSQLPPELLLNIFEHAAVGDMKTARQLTLVSSWIRHWIEPLLYHTVVLSTAPALRSFVYALEQKPSQFAHHVKNLGIFALGPMESIEHVLHACTAVDSLACGFTLANTAQLQTPHPETSDHAPDFPKEQHLLGIACRDGWDTSAVSPAVTHLRVHLPSQPNAVAPFARPYPGTEDALGWGVLSSLQALTHLAVVYRPSQAYPTKSLFTDLQHLILPRQSEDEAKPKPNQRPRLQLILVQVVGLASSQRVAVERLNSEALMAGGSSLKIVAERAPSSATVQWEESVRSGKSVWQDAEGVVKERVAKEAARREAGKQSTPKTCERDHTLISTTVY